MPATTVDSAQIRDGTVQRSDLNTSTVGQSVVAKIVQGSNITLSSTGADSGTGDVTISKVPSGPSTDSGNLLTTGSDSLLYLPPSAIQPTIVIIVGQRAFSAIGNGTFEVDQRNAATALTNPANGTFIQDRYQIFKSGTLTGTVNTALQSTPSAPIVTPGTSYGITQNYQRFTVGTAQASLAAGDFYGFTQNVEGPSWRELSSDVHSISLLIRSSVAGLKFSLRLRDSGVTRSLVQQCTIASSNTWTLVQLQNLPVWAGTYSAAAGQIAYLLDIFLACGTTYQAAASNAFQTGDIRGVTGMNNFLATAGATFDIAYISHVPGPNAMIIDKSFAQNLDEVSRYFQKSYPLATPIGSTNTGSFWFFDSLTAVSGAYSAYAQGTRFRKEFAKNPTCTAYNHQTGAANSSHIYYASSGTVPNTIADVAVSSVVSTQNTIAWLNFPSGTSTSPVKAFAEWTADTGW